MQKIRDPLKGLKNWIDLLTSPIIMLMRFQPIDIGVSTWLYFYMFWLILVKFKRRGFYASWRVSGTFDTVPGGRVS